MRVAIAGAGTLGGSLASRLATTNFVTEIHWANQTFEKVESAAVDIEHGLALSPACRRVIPYPLADLPRALARADTLVIALGEGVKQGGTRTELYERNADLLREQVLDPLTGFPGMVVVLTNPLDLLTRLVHVESATAWERTIGLGTVVETARLRRSLAGYHTPRRSPSEIAAYAIGTHDEDFVPVVRKEIDPASARLSEALLETARREVVGGARRVKELAPRASTMHPVVEGAVSVLDAIACDRGTTHTVSVLDPDDPDRLFFSMPCVLGIEGVRSRLDGDLAAPEVAASIERCRARLRARLRGSGT